MLATQQTPLPGTRPTGAHDENDAALRVREMFTRIAPRYDFLNHFLSFSLDHVWRRRTARHFREVLARPDARVLDLCCGTGDLAFALDRERMRARTRGNARNGGPQIIGTDFVEPMLTRAREKAKASGNSVAFAAGDALHLPFADANFDLITAAFGFRNLASYDEGLREFARVLRPGGQVGILEFSEPAGAMAGLFRFYFRSVLPSVGGAISGDKAAYAYLPSSVSKFPSPDQLAAKMRAAGFADVQIARWNFGSVVLHSARKE
jgi:demethylmenaquinone methyltransferase / 2-methoxy-6-polyprenyl-1,4-benzoquinol methylase